MPINNYLSLAEVKAYLPANEINTKAPLWDAPVTTMCEAASREIDTFTWREFGTYAASDILINFYNGKSPLATDFVTSILIDDLAAAPTTVSISPSGSINGFTPLQSTDYILYPYNAANKSRPYTRIDLNIVDGQVKAWPCKPHSIQITGIFGYSTTPPPDIKEATRLTVIEALRRAQQNYIDTGLMMDTGQIQAATKLGDVAMKILLYYRRSRL